MGEADAINRGNAPVTRKSLGLELKKLGLGATDLVLVHTSMSRLGWVCGGPVAVIQALLDVLTPTGTLIMPAHSSDLTNPSRWQAPAVPPLWMEAIRKEMPAFDPRLTPTRGMGVVAESFRTWPEVRRSHHPSGSFCALGPKAEEVLANQDLSDPFGMSGPLGYLYQNGGKVLLLGIQHGSNTSLHLAESILNLRNLQAEAAPLMIEGKRQWVEFDSVAYDDALFDEIGRKVDQSGLVRIGITGSTRSRLMDQKSVVDWVMEKGLLLEVQD